MSGGVADLLEISYMRVHYSLVSFSHHKICEHIFIKVHSTDTSLLPIKLSLHNKPEHYKMLTKFSVV